MQAFTTLFEKLDSTTSTNLKVEVLAHYFKNTPPADSAWALYFLLGRQRKKVMTSTFLRRTFSEASTLPEWLLVESFAHVGDTSETISLLLQQKDYLKAHHSTTITSSGADCPKEALQMSWGEVLSSSAGLRLSWANPAPQRTRADSHIPLLSEWIEQEVLPLEKASEEEKKQRLWQWWENFPPPVIFVANKLLAGGFRVGVSKRLVLRGLAKALEIEESDLTYRLSGHWDPSAEFLASLTDENQTKDISRPYPFYLAYPIEDSRVSLGEDLSPWWAEWKWDGIRCQAIQRDGHAFLWSRGEDLITDSFPELRAAVLTLPSGTVIDAELLAWRKDRPLPFADLQVRLGRLKPSQKIMDQAPTLLMIYDLLEVGGVDQRQVPFIERREKLEALLKTHSHPSLRISPEVRLSTLDQIEDLRKQSRESATEGLMIKKRDSIYREGRKRGDWWKYKVDPFTIDAVLIYAQAGTGRRSNLFTDYTFAVWKDQELLPIAKAYSGLTDEEIRQLDSWIRRNTTEKFGPVRSVVPQQVFELAFENISASKRHKSGIAVRFPRILRWRKDKPAREADSIETLQSLI